MHSSGVRDYVIMMIFKIKTINQSLQTKLILLVINFVTRWRGSQASIDDLAYFEDKSFNRIYKTVTMNIVLMLYIQNNIHGFDK